MTLAPRDCVYAVQLAFFAIILLPMNVIVFKRGMNALASWLFVALFCAVRIVATALLLNADLSHQTSEAGSILYSVAVAPLMFAILGITQEASATVKHRHPRLLGHFAVIVCHLAVIVAIVLLIIGFVNVISDLESNRAPTTSDDQLVQAGASLLIPIVLGISAIALFSYSMPRNSFLEKRLITGVVLTLPFLFLRILYSFLGTVIDNASWNFITGGTIAELVCLDVLPEFAIVTVLLVFGWLTRNLRYESRVKQANLPTQATYSTPVAEQRV